MSQERSRHFEVRTPETNARSAAEHWREQYTRKDGSWSTNRAWSRGREDVYRELLSLEEPTPEAVDRIIGNPTWTRTRCGTCMDEGVPVISFDVADGEYGHSLCASCLAIASHTLAQAGS